MTIFYMELKKIWNLPTIFLLLVIMGVNFAEKTETSHHVNDTNGVNGDEWSVMIELSEAFGTSLEEDELPLAREMLADLHRELDGIIQNHEDHQTNEVQDFATFKENEEKSPHRPSPENGEALGNYMYEYHWELLYKEQNFTSILNSYEEMLLDPSHQYRVEEQKELALSQWSQGKGRSLVPYHLEYMTQGLVYEHFFDTIMYVFILLLPTIVRDRKNNLRDLQWSSVTGRSILKWQYMAHWATALVLLLPSPLFFLYYFDVEVLHYFWEHSMLFFHYGFGYLLDFTYKELLFCYLLFSFILSIFISGVIFLLSQYSKNYPSLLLKALPLAYLLYATGDAWMRLFSLNHRQFIRFILPWSAWQEIYLLAFALLLVTAVTAYTFYQEKQKDLLEE